MAREFEPVVGQWYENIDENESFRVLSVDEDAELIEIEYLDGDIEELDVDTWAEFDLDKIEQPEGWSGAEVGVKDKDKDKDKGKDKKADDEDDEDDDWDEDDDDDDDDLDEDDPSDDNY